MTRLNTTSQDYRDAKNHIYGLAHNVCVNGKEQRALLTHLQFVEVEAINEGIEGRLIIESLLGTILDGLKFGNWPWIKNGINTLDRK